jgi:hypothetical protein
MADFGVRVGIIGAGALGGALIDRLLASGSIRPADIVACEPREARRKEIVRRFHVTVTVGVEDAAACGINVLADSKDTRNHRSTRPQPARHIVVGCHPKYRYWKLRSLLGFLLCGHSGITARYADFTSISDAFQL